MAWQDLQVGILEVFAEAHHVVDHKAAWFDSEWTWSDVHRARVWRRRQTARGRCTKCSAMAVAGRSMCRRHLEADRGWYRALPIEKKLERNRSMYRAQRAGILTQRELVARRRGSLSESTDSHTKSGER